MRSRILNTFICLIFWYNFFFQEESTSHQVVPVYVKGEKKNWNALNVQHGIWMVSLSVFYTIIRLKARWREI